MAIDKKKNLAEINNEVITPADGDRFYMAEKVGAGETPEDFADSFVKKENMPGGGGGGSTNIYTGTVISEQVMALDGDKPDFSSIPTGFDKLVLEYACTIDNTGTGFNLSLIVNTDVTPGNYRFQRNLVNNGSPFDSAGNEPLVAFIAGNNSTTFESQGEIVILDYDKITKVKMFRNCHGDARTVTNLTAGLQTMIWKIDDTAINRLRLDNSNDLTGDGFSATSLFRLVGYKVITV